MSFSPSSKIAFWLFIAFLLVETAAAQPQEATLSIQQRSIKTYPFGDPDPVPILGDNPKIYPYYKFEGYSQEGKPQDWKVVTLENEFLQVFVMPEAGGKVWGAIEKSTGKEFIYRNEVMKFRNIAMRGPWTSGGIEFNFGIIGHTPATATPVDYLTQKNADGSVECIVGAMDLPSRTQWRVKIKLPKDKAYFETEALWYNPTPIRQSYYNWMTAAAFARPDLSFYCPGNQFLEHSGEARPWPLDREGRRIDQYDNNQFASHKSYHVVGEYNDFFGGYYHNEGWGFGHWSPYDQMPGKKLWLWSQARDGGIWEDLLTDTDGQYIEFQAGRLFVQYFPGDHVNPIRQAPFEPYATDTWRELWFPVKSIGGLSDVSPAGVLYVERRAEKLHVGLNAFAHTGGKLSIQSGNENLLQTSLQLQPMEVVTFEVALPESAEFVVEIPEMDLRFASSSPSPLARPFDTGPLPSTSASEQAFAEGIEWLEYREYERAREALGRCLQADGAHQRALAAMAELEYRQGRYAQGLEWIHKALRLDAYNAEANYTGGILYRAQGDLPNALEALGWAARSLAYRSAAYAQMAEIYLGKGRMADAANYARMALDFNRYNLSAWSVLAIHGRQTGNKPGAEEAIGALLDIDPLFHQARFEKYLLEKTPEALSDFQKAIGGEFPEQTYLEMALDYYHKNQKNEAINLLALAARLFTNPEISLWHSFLQKDKQPEEARRSVQEALERSPLLVFPYRQESLAAWKWAHELFPHDWKAAWYLALNHWALGNKEEAWELLKNCAQQPDFAHFYLSRHELSKIMGQAPIVTDLKRAHELGANDWRCWDALINDQIEQGNAGQAQQVGMEAFKKFPDNYTIGLDLVRAQVAAKQYKEAILQLKTLQVLPFELAYESRILYERAHTGQALLLMDKKKWAQAIEILLDFKKWPEHLGVGRPYHPDERLADYLLAKCYRKLGKTPPAEELEKEMMAYSRMQSEGISWNDLIALKLLSPPEAEILLGKLRQQASKGNTSAKWVLAQHYQDEEGQHTASEAMTNQMKTDAGFVAMALKIN